jgi:peptide/nickel transport system permease protein
MAESDRRNIAPLTGAPADSAEGVPSRSEPYTADGTFRSDASRDVPPAPRTSAFDVGQPANSWHSPPARRSRIPRVPPFLRQLLRNRKAAFGLLVLTVFVLMAIFAPLLTKHNPTLILDAMPDQPPSPADWFGSNHQGQDIFAQVVYGARASLIVGCAAAVLATLISGAMGMTSAYLGGWVDDTLVLITNIFLIIPTLPLLIVISSYLPFRGPVSMILIVGLTTWPGEERVLRSQALSLRNRDFVLAAASLGEPLHRIVFTQIMPNMISRIAAGFLGSFVGAVLYEAGLEFLGFGDVNNISWGTTLFWAQNNSALEIGDWWHFTFPGLAISLTAAALIFVNYGVDEISNPRLQSVKMPSAREIAREKARAAAQGAHR